MNLKVVQHWIEVTGGVSNLAMNYGWTKNFPGQFEFGVKNVRDKRSDFVVRLVRRCRSTCQTSRVEGPACNRVSRRRSHPQSVEEQIKWS